MNTEHDGASDRRDLERLRWKCRRGLLELDLVLRSFLSNRAECLSDQQIKVLSQLLDYPDNELWDLISERQSNVNAALEPLVRELRAETCCGTL